jgi:prophage DNA circulation protein
MKRTTMKLTLILALAAAAVLALGANVATAHGGKGGRLGGASTTKLVNAAAKQLNVTLAKLKAAMVASAEAQINEAAADEEIDADEAADLKDEVQDNLKSAYALSRASTVAKELGITTAQLNNGFRAARKALIVAQIDDALEDGDIDADEAAEAKAELDDADLPGYKQSRFGFRGGFGGRGPHGP